MRPRKLAPRLRALWPALSAVLVVVGAAGSARALPLLTLSGSACGLYGSPTGDQERNPYGAGFGLRLGVTLPGSLYAGTAFDYFFGDTDPRATDPEVSRSLLQLLLRAGYDWSLGPVTLRPQLGFGLARSKVETGPVAIGSQEIEDDQTTTASDFVLAPGLDFSFGFGLLTLGAEASYNKVFADGEVEDAVVLGLGIGFSL